MGLILCYFYSFYVPAKPDEQPYANILFLHFLWFLYFCPLHLWPWWSLTSSFRPISGLFPIFGRTSPFTIWDIRSFIRFYIHLPFHTVRHKLLLIPGTTVVDWNSVLSELVHIPLEVHQDRKRPEITAKIKLFPSGLAYHDFTQIPRKERMGGAEWVN